MFKPMQTVLATGSMIVAQCLILSGCGESRDADVAISQAGSQMSPAEAANEAAAPNSSTKVQPAGAMILKAKSEEKFRVTEWTELMPKDDLDAFLNPPESLNDIEDGSAEDQIASQIQASIEKAGDSRYQQALVSTRVVPEFDGKNIRLPGFVVPLEFSEEQQVVTRFFLVPYFGACVHVPPPPPNQLVYAEFDEGFKLEYMDEPVWLSGKLNTTLTENDIAKAAYAMQVKRVEPYP